jgi:oxygen-independent coproporphyrinogen III oxidase
MPETILPGIYVHLPFCHSKCTYCGFVTGSYDADLAARYVAALEKEIRTIPHPPSPIPGLSSPIPHDSLYFGGGTPSILSVADLARVVAACRETFQLTEDAEITLEVNPGDTARAGEWRELGFNRASLGVQSFLDHELRATGRDHTVEDARRAFADLRDAGFDNLSLDLIAGLPKQTLSDWKSNLEQALALEPEHLSLYLLEIKDGTKLAQQVAAGKLPAIDDDLAAEMYEHLVETVTAQGFDGYEISNFARPGRRSRHNLKYWTDVAYAAFGVGAHGYDGEERFWNVGNIHEYVEKMERDGSARAGRSERGPRERWHEALMMGLRLREGVSVAALQARYGVDIRRDFAGELDRLHEAGAIVFEGDILRLTPRGVLVSNEVFLAFL